MIAAVTYQGADAGCCGAVGRGAKTGKSMAGNAAGQLGPCDAGSLLMAPLSPGGESSCKAWAGGSWGVSDHGRQERCAV